MSKITYFLKAKFMYLKKTVKIGEYLKRITNVT